MNNQSSTPCFHISADGKLIEIQGTDIAPNQLRDYWASLQVGDTVEIILNANTFQGTETKETVLGNSAQFLPASIPFKLSEVSPMPCGTSWKLTYTKTKN